MSVFDGPFRNHELLRRTSIFGLPLWILIVILVVGLLILLLLFTIFLCIIVRRRRRKSPASFVRLEKLVPRSDPTPSLSNNVQDTIHISVPDHQPVPQYSPATPEPPAMVSDRWSSQASGKTRWTGPSVSTSKRTARRPPDVSNEGWGHWYTLKELEAATNGFAEENVIEKGGYGIVYHGVLRNKTLVAVKDLLNDRGQAERDFQVEVEANGRVRHKNLVSLLGYCIDGAYRMLVYEYLDNGNLEQWLYGNVGQESPLTWDIRMKIILGTAKCLGYLHEGLEPKVVHRDVKSSNILLDQQWNPKVSDFGLAKFLGSERTYVSTRVMGTLGYVAPEYACTGKLNEMSDVYSFGILMMEIISGRTPVDYNRRPGEVNLVDWLKTMVGNRRSEQVVDPKLPEIPSSKALKRVILVALRCVDPDATKRPKMGNVVNMLEGEDLLFREVRRIARETSCPRKN